jgi:hypothetical protein
VFHHAENSCRGTRQLALQFCHHLAAQSFRLACKEQQKQQQQQQQQVGVSSCKKQLPQVHGS